MNEMNDDRNRRFWMRVRVGVALGIVLYLALFAYMVIGISHAFDNIKD